MTEYLEAYRRSEPEQARTSDLLSLIPKGRKSVLDVGARDGHFSRLLTEYFDEVTALDLERPSFDIPRVETVAGDATALRFADNSFDCVFCAEVLEHIPNVEAACREIMRVARHEIIIGVPFDQDTRLGMTTCPSCASTSPPWGHVQSFTEARLLNLFRGMRVLSKSFVGSTRERTNAVCEYLMTFGRNPWGTYEQEEPCARCGAKLSPPNERSFAETAAARVALMINNLQASFTTPRPKWIHLVLGK